MDTQLCFRHGSLIRRHNGLHLSFPPLPPAPCPLTSPPQATAEWAAELQPRGALLQRMGQDEARWALAKAEARVRATLVASEAAQRGTYARVREKWALESREAAVRKALPVPYALNSSRY